MVYFDAENAEPTPGISRFRVKYAEQRASRKGDQMFDLKMESVTRPGDDLRAYIMLEGNGKADGRRQLSALVPAGFRGHLEAQDLVGAVAWVETELEHYQGRPQLRVKSRGGMLRCAGFQPESETPDMHNEPAPTQEQPPMGVDTATGEIMGGTVDDTPF